MALLSDFGQLDKGVKGDWFFTENDENIVIRFGDTRDDIVVIPIKATEFTPQERCWNWDGNREAPTITPSIKMLPNGWHGYLRAGKLETA